ncbi:MAG TPA: subclass B3 metallo-beta-lactamase [Pyrinomonadaceae bacterium]|nr:subclass B3 metallo-beta-lactamase [Pyrinomonadaceae bacterium]
MRRICFRLSISLLLTLLCLARAVGQATEEARSWNQPIEPYRVIGNVYYVGASDITSFLIVTPAGHILLDGGFAETVPLIKRNVERLGFRLEDIKILLNSQAHYDHAGGLAQLKQETGAQLAASEADAALLAAGGRGDFHFGDRLPYEPVKADRLLRDGDQVRLGGVTMTARLTPGHTRGCTTWTMRVKEGRKHYDVVFVGSTTVPGYKLVGNSQYPEIVADYARTFRVMKRLPCDVFLASHGNFYSMREKAELLAQGKRPNPFIDGLGYKRFIAETEKAFREQLRREKLSQNL